MTEQATPDILETGNRRMPEYLKPYLLRLQGGKRYLPVQYRVVWFRDECPDYGIETLLIEGGQEAGFATVQARILTPDGRVIAAGTKTETKQDFPAGWVEKAESGAVGRALSFAGFGTQFDLDDDGTRPADSPVSRPGATENGSVRFQGQRDVRSDSAPGTDGTPVQPPPINNETAPCPICHAPSGKRHTRACGAVLMDVPAGRAQNAPSGPGH